MIKFSEYVRIYEAAPVATATADPAAPAAAPAAPAAPAPAAPAAPKNKATEYLSSRYRNLDSIKQNISYGKKKGSTGDISNNNKINGLKLDSSIKNIKIEGDKYVYDLSYVGNMKYEQYSLLYYNIKSEDPVISKYKNSIDTKTFEELKKALNIMNNEWKPRYMSDNKQKTLFDKILINQFIGYKNYPDCSTVFNCINILQKKYPNLYNMQFGDIYKQVKSNKIISNDKEVWYIQKFNEEHKLFYVTSGSELKIGDYIQFKLDYKKPKNNELGNQIITESFKIKNIQQKTNTTTTPPTI